MSRRENDYREKKFRETHSLYRDGNWAGSFDFFIQNSILRFRDYNGVVTDSGSQYWKHFFINSLKERMYEK